jgi:hypothetical protein
MKEAEMARRRKTRKGKPTKRRAEASRKPKRVTKSKRKTVVSVKSGKGSATVELRGLKPTGGTIQYGDKRK